MEGSKVKKIRVALVDDSRVFRRAIKRFLTKEKNIAIVAEISFVGRLLETLKRKKPDLILLDIRLRDTNSLYWVDKIKNLLPQSIIFVLTSYDYPTYRRMAEERGVPEYILKRDVSEVLLPTIHRYFELNGD
ncbi:MAG TPA: response regulator transcription factor [bacterium (Candidatus Stahlbacteria)]|nr:response regulator transcription factor [Candidatus Stahlbacteria bacterium]